MPVLLRHLERGDYTIYTVTHQNETYFVGMFEDAVTYIQKENGEEVTVLEWQSVCEFIMFGRRYDT